MPVCFRFSGIIVSIIFLNCVFSAEQWDATDDFEYYVLGRTPIKINYLKYCPENYNDTPKLCNLQGSLYRQKWFHIEAGYRCYSYTNPNRFKPYAKFNRTEYAVFDCLNTNTTLHVSRLDNGKLLWYDFKNETALEYIKATFKKDAYYELWLECCKEADVCCINVMNNTNVFRGSTHCPAIWDSWSCFSPASANSIAKMTCSKQAYSSTPLCDLQSEKRCFVNATWNQTTDYTTCSITPFRTKRLYFHLVVLIISTVLCIPAVVIFFSFEKFRRTTRIVLHRNLILSIIIRNILSIMTEQIILLDSLKPSKESEGIMEGNSVACRVLTFFENASKNGMYACMLVDGFYLHKIIVRSFADDPSVYLLYGVTAGLTFIPSLIWAICNGAAHVGNCWMVDEGYQTITDVVRIVIVAANVLLLGDIIRSIIMKLKYSSSSKQTRATLNATLFLIPLFGLHIIFIMYRGILHDNSCTTQDIYYYISYTMEGLQGVMVSILFCYINNEVHKEIKNAYRKCSIFLEQRFDFTLPKTEFLRRRTTTTTVVGSEAYTRSRLTLNEETFRKTLPTISENDNNINDDLWNKLTYTSFKPEGNHDKDTSSSKEATDNEDKTGSVLDLEHDVSSSDV